MTKLYADPELVRVSIRRIENGYWRATVAVRRKRPARAVSVTRLDAVKATSEALEYAAREGFPGVDAVRPRFTVRRG